MSLSKNDINMLFQFGFILETWDKREDKANDFIGLTKIPFDKLK